MKRIIAIIMIMVIMVFGITACNGKNDQPKTTQGTQSGQGETQADQGTTTNKSASGSSLSEELSAVIEKGENLTGKHRVKIKVKNYGTITVKLDADKAPITVTNFIKLAGEGFYDGLTFHRIISSFMIQGGDPLGNGTGGSDENIKGEFSSNGVENNIKHVRGTISMARSTDPDSASSQFFIMHQDADYLDGEYAAFGKVTKGMKIVDKICANTQVEDRNGTVLPENQPVIEKVTVID